MDKYQARLLIKERIEDFLLSFRSYSDFCDIVSRLSDEHLSLKQIDSSILIERNNDSFFIGDPSAMTDKGFGFEYINDTIYMGEWQNGKYNGYGYLFSSQVCYYGTFIDGAYKDFYIIIDQGNNYIF